MYYAEDEQFARRLQYELHAYENFKHQKENTEKENLNPIDSKLEYIDPTPSIHDLFVKFDKKFFWNTLGMVQVLWSNKMTKCAGMCSFEGGRGLCKISLSAPLLSLRPRKDLVETLLHEMIHAYLFVTHNYKDREDHGPEFHKHMYRINKQAGTNITVYHTFYDEVEYYQRHIWRCDGPCQKKKPYFGFVRRAINRAPGPSDTWWKQHQSECGGTFVKISEPEGKIQKVRKTKVVKPVSEVKSKDIRDFFKHNSYVKSEKPNSSSNIKTLSDLKNSKPVGGTKTNAGTGTLVVTKTSQRKDSKGKSQKSPNSSKESGKQIKSGCAKEVNKIKASSSSVTDESKVDGKECENVKETVRNIWANKFLNHKSSGTKLPEKPSPKKIKLECSTCSKAFTQDEFQNHVKTCSEKDENLPLESSSCEKPDEMKHCPVCNEKFLQSEMNDHLENCLSCSFKNENENDFDDEIVCESVPCPCCYKWFEESEMNSHIDECLTLTTLKEEILLS